MNEFLQWNATEKTAFFVGILAVILYFLGYQQKRRSRIIMLNASSRILYIIQYILLGAFEGAALDIVGTISSLLAQKKNTTFIQKHFRLFVTVVNLMIIAAGLPLYKNIFSLFPIIGVLLHTGAFWIDDEKRIRQVSLLGSPFWLIYNFVSGAYGSCIGDILSIISLATAMYRYDFRKSKKTTLLLIRHGMSEANREGFFAGQTDVSLIEDGITQAKETAGYIKENYKVDRVYASDLIRACRTGQIIAEKLGLDVTKHKGLREINAGKWHGMKFENITEEYGPEFEIWLNDIGNSQCPGGESVKELGERVMKTLTEIATKNLGKTIVIATHATPIRVSQTMIQHGDISEMKNVPFVSNASVTVYEYTGGKWECTKISEDKHLSVVSHLTNV